MGGMHIDPSELEPLAAYKLATSIIVPRPIAWVGSRSLEGSDNLAPFSYFMGVSTRPPSIAISIARGRKGVLKDSASNILATKEFTVSVVSYGLSEKMVASSKPWPSEVSEFEAVGLTVRESDLIDAPRPAESLVSMECTLVHVHDMQSTHLMVGEVLRYHLNEKIVLTDEKGHRTVDVRGLNPIGRLGGYEYCLINDRFSMKAQK